MELFTGAHGDKASRNGFKLRESKFRLDIRKEFFNVWVVRHWIRLSREVLATPSLEVFKARFDVPLSTLGSVPAHNKSIGTR